MPQERNSIEREDMTENEAIKAINDAYETFMALHTKPDFDTAMAVAIKALEEIQQYRATMLTPEQVRKLQMDLTGWIMTLDEYRAIGTLEELQSAVNFKNYFMELYGEGLEVANWHKNGDLEPLATFIDSALEPAAVKNSDKAMVVVDMPKSCSKCKFMYEFYGVKKCQLLNILQNGGVAIIPTETLTTARKDCCPLVPLTESKEGDNGI